MLKSCINKVGCAGFLKGLTRQAVDLARFHQGVLAQDLFVEAWPTGAFISRLHFAHTIRRQILHPIQFPASQTHRLRIPGVSDRRPMRFHQLPLAQWIHLRRKEATRGFGSHPRHHEIRIQIVAEQKCPIITTHARMPGPLQSVRLLDEMLVSVHEGRAPHLVSNLLANVGRESRGRGGSRGRAAH